MVHNPDDQYQIICETIKNPVMTVHETAYSFAEFRFKFANHRVPGQQIKGSLKSKGIFVGYIRTETDKCIFVNGFQVFLGRYTQYDINHAGRAVLLRHVR